jgi:hypothetical protein
MSLFTGEVSLSKICLDDNIDLYNGKELNECSNKVDKYLVRILIK